MAGDLSSAMTARSLRMVRSELDFLADCSVITRQQLNSILSQLPEESATRSVSRSQQPTPAQPSPAPLPEPVQALPPPAPYSPPVSQMHNVSLNEKSPANQYVAPPPQMPPPAYPQVPPILSVATALYAYQPTDAGDLALAPNDRIQVIEHMNDDWWRGRNERTGMEGIFPRSYVDVNEKGPMPPQPTNYGNVPLEVSQGGGPSNPQSNEPSKFQQGGKKLGKKFGNAAVFGAGATAGSNLVNMIM